MRILFVTRRYWPAVGGVESFVRDIALALARRHQIRVLSQRVDNGPHHRLTDSLQPPPAFEPFMDGVVEVEQLRISVARRAALAPLVMQVVPGLRRYAYGRNRRWMATLYANVAASTMADHKRPDIIHMWGPDLLAAAAVRAAQRLGVPSVVTASIHRGQWGDDPASAAAYRKASSVVAQLASEALVYEHLGVPRERIAVLGGCAQGVRRGGGHDIRKSVGVDGPLVLFIGARRSYKGVDVLLSAAEIVASRRSDVAFAFVGPGPKITGRHRARVLDVGYVDDATRSAWIDAASVVCLPSAAESFGIAVLEAWSLAKPVVGSDIAAFKELIGQCQGGVVVSRDPRAFADALIDVLANPAIARAMGERGRAHWERHFTVDVVAKRHEELYALLTGNERKPSRA
jgi:glycosyltransferase involved in cell wall biosynthesis